MAAALLCALSTAALTLSPDRPHHFTLSRFSVRCPSDSWSVYRRTASDGNSSSPCARPWGKPQDSGCLVGPALLVDSGLYWCQDRNQTERCTSKARITVYRDTAVLLETPLFPVPEGQNVTLRCLYRSEEHLPPNTNFTASFFKDGKFLGTFDGGRMLLRSVSKADEGWYKCEHPNMEKSPQSHLTVQELRWPRAPASASPPPDDSEGGQISLYRLLCFVLLFLLDTALLAVGLSVYCRWRRARAEEKSEL